MVVGVLRLTLHIEGAASLKDKRQVVRKVVDRLRSRFNVSVAEVGDNDIWQRARIGISAVANDHSFVNEVLDKCTRDAGSIAEILDREMEIETYGQMNADWSRKPDFEAHDLSRLPPEKDEELPEQQLEAGWLKEEDLE
jgi:uncharacterized protein YlxP (DUF503 family)